LSFREAYAALLGYYVNIGTVRWHRNKIVSVVGNPSRFANLHQFNLIGIVFAAQSERRMKGWRKMASIWLDMDPLKTMACACAWLGRSGFGDHVSPPARSCHSRCSEWTSSLGSDTSIDADYLSGKTVPAPGIDATKVTLSHPAIYRFMGAFNFTARHEYRVPTTLFYLKTAKHKIPLETIIIQLSGPESNDPSSFTARSLLRSSSQSQSF
jgi:hypothetical protein